MLSFGYSLLTGVILNFLCSIVTSKLMIKSLSNYEKLRKSGFYGNGKKPEKVFKFYQNRINCYLVSLAIFLVDIVCIFTNGVNFDIKFKDGVIINYTYTQGIDTNKAVSVAEDTLGRQCDVQIKSDLTSDSTKLVLKKILNI